MKTLDKCSVESSEKFGEFVRKCGQIKKFVRSVTYSNNNVTEQTELCLEPILWQGVA